MFAKRVIVIIQFLELIEFFTKIYFDQKQYQNMKIVVSGGGICGLTFAIAAKKAGLNPIVLEKSSNVYAQTFGGGIGLWPPSQAVYEQLGLIQKLRSVSLQMPKAAYFNQKGWKLGEPSSQFPSKYKIFCLEREALCRILSQQCKNLQIEVKTGTSVVDAKSTEKNVSIELSNGQNIQADVLVGADGINSVVRNIIMRDRKLPQIKPSHCGYAYFRSVVDLSDHPPANSQWHNYAFESWGQEKRFGYVPLKQPKTFWFFSVPINKQGLGEYLGSHLCSESQKQWIIKQIGHWKGPLPLKQLVQMTPANKILRTDIRKIKGVTEFPWTSRHNNIIIIGDAANATAPNLAQGAGLAIQSAWDLVSMVDFSTNSGIDDFLKRRRKRAITVQTIADLVATIGQIHNPYASLRNVVMATSSSWLPTTQKQIFEAAVRYSLGGSSSTPYWLPSLNKNFIGYGHRGNLLKTILKQEQYLRLPKNTQEFRSSYIGRGSGLVSVKSGILGKIFGLPSPMENKKFQASVDVEIDNHSYKVYQKWTRIFGSGTPLAKKYSTIHEIQPDFYSKSPNGLTLVESLGDKLLLRWIKFGYDISINNNIAKYKSNSIWFCNTRLPIPKILLPKSEWIEQQTKRGWNFDGKISFPSIIGGAKFFQYKGSFQNEDTRRGKDMNVIIAGGTGFIGSSVVRQFYKQGWQVTILSRKGSNIPYLPFAKIVKWDPCLQHQTLEAQSDRLAKIIMKAEALINLSGQNPGSSRWNENKKNRIINSRLQSINLLSKSIQKSNNKQLSFIQASAAGIYGNRGQQILKDSNPAGSKESFRVHTCVQIENLSKKVFKDVIIARIGHVLGQSDGIYPFLKLSSKLRAKSFGQGGQFIPWIHVQDVARAFYFMVSNPAKFVGNQTNVVAPEHMTYDELYKKMGEVHSRGSYFNIPSSILKLALGQLSSVILQSQRMHPQRLIDEGYSFKYAQFKTALLSKELL